MGRPERQQTILDLLKELKGLEPLKQLFWSELNYERVNQSLSRRGWSDTASKALSDDPVLFASGGQDGGFQVIYARLACDALLLGHERPVVSRLLQNHPYALFIFSDKSQNRWHFLNVKYDEQSTKRRLFRRITVGPEERLRTASERIGLLDLSSISPDLFGLSPLKIQAAHDSAFDVEAVTKQFFEEYKAVFCILEDDLKRQTKDSLWAHDYALQFLNRIMFLYFIQRKRWLGDDTEFMRSFWESYGKSSTQSKNIFFDRWLKVLFFEAFNNKFHGGHRHFPEKIRDALSMAPYLNGGLFKNNELDGRSFTISDERFKQVYTFLERYNFTIAEDSPLDQEVAVDPEMIGKVYESLVNVSTEADERGDAGIFYTPRTEIDLMCRLSLVDYLTNHLGNEHKSLLYETVFAMDYDEKASADNAVAKAGLWPRLSALLREITALDPACGSGSFIVGMLHILNDLQKRANLQLKIEESGFERKKRIIGQSLYGVDVMDWACHVAELRLWLALVIDAEFTREELHVRQEPLLPHFTFKIRCGDSLVQEVGGINFGHIHASKGLTGDLKTRITTLKNEKMKFYNNDPSCQFKSDKALKHAELKLFKEILATQALKKQEKIKELKLKIERPEWKAVSLLDGTVEQKSEQLKLEVITFQKEVVELSHQLDRINHAQAALKNVSDIPFIWDIAFVEIFEGENDGFDIVIGNPPYVRQENISDPHLLREEVTTENKKEYKVKLALSVYQEFPRYFGYNFIHETVKHKLDAKSDLYIYFYFHGLSLLNPKGSFCFITSNSWLDVAYGADLQEFLIKHCHIKMIIDNQMNRSFASADVNTVIALFSSPDDSKEWGLDKTARFVMFKVPFEHILSPVIFEEIENAIERTASQEYRVYPINQRKLFEDGLEVSVDFDSSVSKKNVESSNLIRHLKYEGNKWGGKYLRAPDIFHRICERAAALIVPLGKLGQVRYPIKTGINEFFYLTEEAIQKYGIEKQFLIKVVKSPKEFKAIKLDFRDLSTFLFVCNLSLNELREKGCDGAIDYIKWGSKQTTTARQKSRGGTLWPEVPSVQGRKFWYSIEMIPPADVICNRFFNERFFFGYATFPIIEDQTFYGCTFTKTYSSLRESQIAIMNSTLQFLFVELLGRVGLGEGVLQYATYEMSQMLTLNVKSFKDKYLQAILDKFDTISKREIFPIERELLSDDRKEFDEIIFDALDMKTKERDDVYNALLSLVKMRLAKANSLTSLI